jgi:hypothetical protein
MLLPVALLAVDKRSASVPLYIDAQGDFVTS